MSKFSVKFVNKQGKVASKALASTLDAYRKSADKELTLGMTRAAIAVEGRTKRNIAQIKQTEDKLVDTGTLLNSYTHQVLKEAGRIIGLVGSNLFYAVERCRPAW